MEISRMSACELLDKLDEMDESGGMISHLGGFSRLLALNTFRVELAVADKLGTPTVTVSDSHYNEFASKILNWTA